MIWLRRFWGERVNPPPVERFFGSYLPTAITAFDGRAALLAHASSAIDASSEIAASLQSELNDSGRRFWLTPSEFGLQLAERDVESRAIALGRGKHREATPARVLVSNGKLDLASGIDPTGSLRAPGVEPDGGFAVYSAIEDSAYIIGGTENGRPTGLIRRYSFESDVWTILGDLSSEFSPRELVLGAAYDSVGNALYVLDASAAADGRLIRYDVAEGTAAELWSVPFSGAFSRVDLGRTIDGAIIVSVQSLDEVTVWKLKPTADSVVFEGGVELVGQVVDAPVPGYKELHLPIMRNDALALESIDRMAFSPGIECTSL